MVLCSSFGRIMICLLVIGMGAVGCGRIASVEISGTVRIESTIVPQGTIAFRPADGKGPTAEGVIQEGRYQLMVPPGVKKVVIQGYRVVGELHPWGPNAPSAPKLEPILPANMDPSKLEMEIREPNPRLDFDL